LKIKNKKTGEKNYTSLKSTKNPVEIGAERLPTG